MPEPKIEELIAQKAEIDRQISLLQPLADFMLIHENEKLEDGVLETLASRSSELLVAHPELGDHYAVALAYAEMKFPEEPLHINEFLCDFVEELLDTRGYVRDPEFARTVIAKQKLISAEGKFGLADSVLAAIELRLKERGNTPTIDGAIDHETGFVLPKPEKSSQVSAREAKA